MANVNGEVTLKLGETDYVLIPKWSAIKELENTTDGSGLMVLANKIQNVSPTAIVSVLLIALKHSGYKNFTEDSLGEQLAGGKLKYAKQIASEWILAFMTPPDEIKQPAGEEKPVEA